MIYRPEILARSFVDAGCSRLIVHAEACTHLHRMVDSIREMGAQAGVALNPATPISAVEHVLDLVDLVLVMTVNPGFGGQQYITTMEPKISELDELLERRGLRQTIDIEIDGGVSAKTIAGAAAAGANVFVAGSALFRHPGGLGPATAELRSLARTTVAS
jgi:ribulose-phosphate 3-epimerase